MANKPRNVLKREEYEILALKNHSLFGNVTNMWPNKLRQNGNVS